MNFDDIFLNMFFVSRQAEKSFPLCLFNMKIVTKIEYINIRGLQQSTNVQGLHVWHSVV